MEIIYFQFRKSSQFKYSDTVFPVAVNRSPCSHYLRDLFAIEKLALKAIFAIDNCASYL